MLRDLLRSHVEGGTDNFADAGMAGFTGRTGDAEVDQHHSVAGFDEQIRRLDIAMYDARDMRGMQGERSLDDHLQGPRRVEAAGAGDLVGQRLTVDVSHDQVRHPPPAGMVDLAVVVDLHDAGMVQRGQGAGFGLESGPEGGVRAYMVTQQLDRHYPGEHGVGRSPHFTHPAGGNLIIKAVPALKHISRNQHTMVLPIAARLKPKRTSDGLSARPDLVPASAVRSRCRRPSLCRGASSACVAHVPLYPVASLVWRSRPRRMVARPCAR
jgi:hypothetical protein